VLLLDLFLIGLVVTLEPIPLTGMILLLAAERGLLKGLGYTLGWLFTLVAIVAITVLVTGGKPLVPKSNPSTAALAVKLLIGAVLVWIGYRRWVRQGRTWRAHRPAPGSPPKKQPRWMAGIDRINPLAAAGLGFLLQPWVLVAAGVATVTQAKLSSAAEYLAVFGFCLLCSASYLTLEIYAALRPETVKSRLSALLEWISTHTDQVIVFLSLGIGLYLVGESIAGLVEVG
jgi:threonine/homoserine/homoserine lactone efflux protein